MTIWEAAKRESHRGVSLIDALAWLLSYKPEQFPLAYNRDAASLVDVRFAMRERAREEAEEAQREFEKRQKRLHPHEPLAPVTTSQRRKAKIAGLLS